MSGNVTFNQLAQIFREIAEKFQSAAEAAEIATIPKMGHFVYGTASGNSVSLECNGLTAECPVLDGRFGYDQNAISIPAAYGSEPGAYAGQPLHVYLDGVLRATFPFQEGGLTELSL
jgi:hypothetical protein